MSTFGWLLFFVVVSWLREAHLGLHIKRLCGRCTRGEWCGDEERDKAWELRHDRLCREEDERLANPPQRQSHGYGIARHTGWDQWGRRTYSQADPIEEDRRG